MIKTDKINSIEEILKAESKKLKNAQISIELVKEQGIMTIFDIDTPKIFFNLVSILSTQSKATKIESFVRNRMNWEKVSASENKGDAFDSNKKEYIEFKISTSNADAQINAVQLRPWQPVQKYLLGYIDEENFSNSHIFLLTKEEMLKECKLMKAGAMHGTKEANENNDNIELALRLPIDENNEHYIRWCKKYRDKKLEIKILGEL